ncbi:MAG: short-chain dehydrogenase [Pseudomonadales bacterium]|nr:short-chain dehydrogenase [Pseudomonadales bacterium]
MASKTMDTNHKTIVITGANSGIGYQVACQLALQGAHIVMACRNPDKAKQAQQELIDQVPDANVCILVVDVSEPASIAEFTQHFAKRFGSLDILINNAGIVAPRLTHNSAGHELHLATNYLGSFALTGSLLPYFSKQGSPRIVNVGSVAHRFGKFDFSDINWEQQKFNHWKAYARSKIAVAAFTLELNRRLKQQGSNIVSVGAHPGLAATDIGQKTGVTTAKNRFVQWYQDKMVAWVVAHPADGALPIVHAATDETVQGGDYYGPNGLFEIKGKPGKARINSQVLAADFGPQLWAVSESMTGVSYLSPL